MNRIRVSVKGTWGQALHMVAGSILFMLVPAQTTHAEGIAADVDTGLRSFAIKGGSSNFFAYSRQDGPVKIGPNTDTFFFEHNANVKINLPANNDVLIVVNGLLTKDLYGPVVGGASQSKPTGTEMDWIDSYSSLGTQPKFEGYASVRYSSNAEKFVASAEGRITGPGKATGAAAGAVFDPFTVETGNHSYSPTLNASFQLSDVSQHGGVNIYALDSRFTDVDTFPQRGQPLDEALWYLSIQTSGPTTSDSLFYVDFKINPLARSLGVFNPAESDSEISAMIANSLWFDSADGSMNLTNFAPFASDTTLNVRPEDGDIEFGMASIANIVAVPEHSSPLLMGVGGVVLLVVCRWYRSLETIDAPPT